MTRLRLSFLYCCSILLLIACNLGTEFAVTTIEPTATLPVVQAVSMVTPATAIPTVVRDIRPVATAVPTATLTVTPTVCPQAEPDENTQYTVQAVVDYPQKVVTVLQHIRYGNLTTGDLDSIVLDVEANILSPNFEVLQVQANSQNVSYTLESNRLEIQLPEPLEADCSIILTLNYTLKVPPIEGNIAAYRGFLGHSVRQLNLGHWLPMVATHSDGEWILHEPIFVGEQIVLEQADWVIDLEVQGASDRLQIAAPGMVERRDMTHWRIVHNNSRDLALTIADAVGFEALTAQTPSGVAVEVYRFADSIVNGVDSGAFALDVAVKSLAHYESLFGEYPYPRMVVVQGDFPDGMEFSGLVYVSGSWFYGYEGDPAGFLLIITAHEVAHQWWYARVGNDSANDPWLDEALATYSEYLFIERHFPQLMNWWWSARVAWYNPQGYVDSTVYEFITIREYINAVYLRGAQMLHNLRQNLGDEVFFDLLRRYIEAGDGKVISEDVFWAQLSPDQLNLTQATRDQFLVNPDISFIPNVAPSE